MKVMIDVIMATARGVDMFPQSYFYFIILHVWLFCLYMYGPHPCSS